MKRYKAIFFDWDGTAVSSRKAPVDEAVCVMAPLLEKGVKLAIISGTTIENIAGGEIESYFSAKQLDNLYLGLGRGAYNYAFRDGKPHILADCIPSKSIMMDIHRICFDIHMILKEQYDLDTDVVFTRPNYCKIDLMVDNNRGDNLFMQENELDILKKSLDDHGIKKGLSGLIELSCSVADNYGIKVVPTCDAKYLEVGISSKSDNVNTIFSLLNKQNGIIAEDCSFWGDEFVGIDIGIFGSDSFMYTELTKNGDFYDVSEVPGNRPQNVQNIGGGINRFLKMLEEQNR